MRPREETNTARLVEYEGGIEAVRKDENILRKLYEAQEKYVETVAERTQQGFDDLKDELQKEMKDVQITLNENFKEFHNKFKLYCDRLEGNLQKSIRELGDRIIKTSNDGPHDLILDPVSDRCRRKIAGS